MITKQSGGATTNQATWYSFRQGSAPEKYAFTFQTSCAGGESVTAPTPASAVAVGFTGVNPITPIDVDNTGAQIYTPLTGVGTSVTPGSVTPFHIGDWGVALYGTTSPTSPATLTSSNCTPTSGENPFTGFQSASGDASATGFCGESNLTPGAPFPSLSNTLTATAGTSAPWITQTIALEAASSSCGTCEYGLEAPVNVSCDGCSNYTNYALAIQAAAAQLQTLASSRPGAENVIILLSNGDAGYPPNTPACNEGISAAEAAEQTTGLDATFFSIAYGASNSTSGPGASCIGDNAPGQDVPFTGLSAQCAMVLMADNSVSDPRSPTNPDGFASDRDAYASLCTNGDLPPLQRFFNVGLGSSLVPAFEQIGSSFRVPRLISNDAE